MVLALGWLFTFDFLRLLDWSLPGAEFWSGGVVKAWGRGVRATKSVWVRVEAWGEGKRGCWGGEAREDSGEREEVVEVREGDATGAVGGGGGGRVMTVATTGA